MSTYNTDRETTTTNLLPMSSYDNSPYTYRRMVFFPYLGEFVECRSGGGDIIDDDERCFFWKTKWCMRSKRTDKVGKSLFSGAGARI